MKYLVASFILLFCTLQTFSQQDYFIYLQTDNNQAFYLRINNTLYSSTASGYLILAKLPDSTANVTIGFAKAVFPEQQFNIPVNRKDAGYLLKNFGEKGWGLFNLQTMAVTMNSNATQEKKSPEIIGSRKNDAFSLLLANAVNDTAVLYVVNKPVKVLPAEPVAIVEKNKDPVDTVVASPVHRDTATLVTKKPVNNDSNVSVKNTMKPAGDSTATTRVKPVAGKTAVNRKKAAADSIALAKNEAKKAGKQPKTPVDTVVASPTHRDTAALVTKKPLSNDSNVSVKSTVKPGGDSIATTRIKPVAGKTAVTKKKATADSIALAKKAAKNAGKPAIVKAAKDTLAVGNTSKPVSPATAIVTNNPVRKDTIIMMSDRPSEDSKLVAEKNAKLAAARKKDSLQLAKKQAGKNNIAAKKQPVTGIPADTVKKDTLISKASTKKDTGALVKTELPAIVVEKMETAAVEAPPKRTKPLVYKAADLLTDTSYVAVFVDESKEKFDTIRISIPFNEAVAAVKKEIAVLKEPAPREQPVAAKKVIDSLNNPSAKPGDTVRETAEKEKLANIKTSPAVIVPVKPDSSPVKQPAKDSLTIVTPPAIVKKDPPATIVADSAKPAKSTATPLFLNSDCKETAQDADIDKLRIKMLLVASDEEKIALAKKVFRQKCFLTTQVKALSELFKTDEGKYKWFDAVYAFVSDSGNFSKLSELLKDEYYLNRFKAMLRN